jgi:prolyl oligopeptidase
MPTNRYPHARTVDAVDDHHGTKIDDPYRWLEDADADDTRDWIAAQNELTEAWLSQVPERDHIRERLTAYWDHPRTGAPWRRGRRWFQLRNTGLQNQDVLYVMDAADAEGEVLLDPNTLSEDGTAALTGLGLTDDGGLLAYAISRSGSDWLTWHVRDVATREDLPDVIEWSKFSGASWTPDGAGFFYSAYDPPPEGQAYEQQNLNQRLYYHRLGAPQSEDVVVYGRPDHPRWGFDGTVTQDGRFVIVSIWEGTERENRIHYIDLSEPTWAVRPLLDEFDAAYHVVGNDGDRLYVLTDHSAPRGRIVAIDLAAPEPDRWTELVAEAEDPLESARMVGDRFVAVYLHHARHVLRRFTKDGTPDGEVPVPGIGAVESMTGRRDDEAIHLTFTSFTAPTAIYRHELDARRTTLVRPPGLDLDPDRYTTQQVFVDSRDGTKVPMFLVHRADRSATDGPHPTLLYGYGGFNIPLTPGFRVAWLVWLELGGVVAVANLRGGGEYGQEWHDAGRLANKQNVFDDAIACAEWLIDQGWATRASLGIQGGSNGGLLVGACMTQRPDLFGAAVPEVGVLDMLRFHKFTIGWGWASDYGTADDPEQFGWLLAYSPLHNLQPGTAYPPTLVTTGDHDDRVVPGHSFKFAAALQAAQDGDAPVLIRVETSAGHGAGKPTAKVIDERTDVLAFLVGTLFRPPHPPE